MPTSLCKTFTRVRTRNHTLPVETGRVRLGGRFRVSGLGLGITDDRKDNLTNVLTGFDSGTGVRDDDEPYEYGSVVYIYNENTVRLFAPNMVNGYASGYTIYTGKHRGLKL